MNIAELKRIAEAATPGEREHIHVYDGEEVVRVSPQTTQNPYVVLVARDYCDGRFAATFSPARILALLRVVEAAVEMREELWRYTEHGSFAFDKALEEMKP
jgi:hypothetical protein